MKQTIQLIEAAHFDFNAITLNILGSTPTFNGIKNLANIHNFFSTPILGKGSDQSTPFHRAIYSDFDSKISLFLPIYYQLIHYVFSFVSVSEGGTKEEWAVQRYPTLRLQAPNNVSVFEFHRDSDYNHPLSEVNCFYAITDCIGSSALHVEQNLGAFNYKPRNLHAGACALLNTSVFHHGDYQNTTDKSRVSFDFRFVLQSSLTSGCKKSLTTTRTFTANDYFTPINSILLYE